MWCSPTLQCVPQLCSAIPDFDLKHYTGAGNNDCTSNEQLEDETSCTVACASGFVPSGSSATGEYTCDSDGSLTPH